MRILLCLLFLLAGDEFAEGVRAYRQGRYEAALRAFTLAEEQAGNEASAELLHNKALAALGAGDMLAAEIAAEKAAVRGGPRFASLRDFLLGNAGFARCEQAEELAARPEAGMPALDEAIAHARAAKGFWELAAMSRSDWPAARRNVERALIKLERLLKKKEDAEKRRKKAGGGRAGPKPQPRTIVQPTPSEGRERRVDARRSARPLPLLGELSPEQVKRLLDKLREKQKEKLEQRRARRMAPRGRVEKDW